MQNVYTSEYEMIMFSILTKLIVIKLVCHDPADLMLDMQSKMLLR